MKMLVFQSASYNLLINVFNNVLDSNSTFFIKINVLQYKQKLWIFFSKPCYSSVFMWTSINCFQIYVYFQDIDGQATIIALRTICKGEEVI